METEDSEETTITSPFGPMYLIYTPKGQRNAGRNTASSGSGRIDDTKSHPKGEVRGEKNFVKKEIKANWAEDPNMKAEKSKDRLAHPILGRHHGFSATGVTVAEFEKVINSLHPIRP